MSRTIEFKGTAEVDYDQWYMMAEAHEVYNVLNALAMTFETFDYQDEDVYGNSIRMYRFDEETFFKAEALWAEREGL